MCPNERCEHYGKPTGLLGGCDCGEPLVPFSAEPTNEQLARLVSMFSTSTVASEDGIGPISVEQAKRELDEFPSLRRAWLVRHREVQAALRG
jgi:hypothetical protein